MITYKRNKSRYK